MISLPYYTIQISGTHLLANHLRKISFTITIKHLTSMIVCYAQQKTEVLDRYKTMFLAIIGDNLPFLLRILRKSFCFPRTTAAFTIILYEKNPCQTPWWFAPQNRNILPHWQVCAHHHDKPCDNNYHFHPYVPVTLTLDK